MKKTTLALVMTVFAASSSFSAFSRADGPQGQPSQQQGHGGQGGQGGPGGRDGGHGGGHQGGPGGGRGHEGGRGGGPGHERGPHGNPGRPGGPRDHFAWNGHDFRRGHPAPPRFRGDDYRVYNWHARGLQAPPPGEHWAYIDGNYVLIAAATGIITSIIMSTMLPH